MTLAPARSTAEIAREIRAAIARSPADRTAVTWVEVARRQLADSGWGRAAAPSAERFVLVRVQERGRIGSCGSEADSPAALDAALRQALAAARLAPEPGPWPAGPSSAAAADSTLPLLFDPQLAELDEDRARALVRGELAKRETLDLEWARARFVVADESGGERAVEATAAAARVRCGRRPGSGSAEATARTLAGLDVEGALARARARHAGTGLADLPERPAPAVLSPEAAAALVELLAEVALGARTPAALPPTALAPAADEPLATLSSPPFWTLRDEPCGPGLPFPWDLAGAPRAALDFWRDGRPLAPADPGSEPLGRNLLLVPGRTSEASLCAQAEGGLWIGALERLELSGPPTYSLRAVARGLRRIGSDGALAEAVCDGIWDDTVGRLLASLAALGDRTISRPGRDRLWTAATSPALALTALPPLRPLPV